MKYIATISGGKDSVAMCDLLLKNAYPVDYIVFNDTLDEYDEMYEYLELLKTYFNDRYKKEIIITKPSKTYEEYIFHVKTKGDLKGQVSGLPNPTQGFCEWRGIAKRDALDKFLKQFKKYKIYMGITLSEQHRANRDDDKFLYPLIDNFKMSEENCKQYLINQEMENPLYRHFSRTGCAKCQFKSEKDWFQTWKYYPKVWEELKELEKKVNEIKDVTSRNIFIDFRSCEDMEKKFIKADKQGSLFDFSDEPLKDCFCKI